MSKFLLVYINVSSTNHDGSLLLLGEPDRVRSQITSVVCQIQRFDFGYNLVMTRKVINPSVAALRFKKNVYCLFACRLHVMVLRNSLLHFLKSLAYSESAVLGR